MQELVSVIVPAYRVEGLLERCVDSILSQTHTTLQVILVDDGSPDNCGRICDSYAAQDGRVEVLHQANQGLPAARNSGISIAQGKYIAFVDSDDWVHPQYFETLVNLCEKHEAGMSVCAYKKTQSAEFTHQGLPRELPIQEYTNTEAMAELYGPASVNWVVAWAKIIRRDILGDIRFPVGRVHEDEFIAHRLLFRSERIVRTDARLYYYWQRPDSLTSTLSMARRRDTRLAMLDRGEFMRDAGLYRLADLTYRRSLHRFISDEREAQHLGDADARAEARRDLIDLRQASRLLPDRPLRVRLGTEAFTRIPSLLPLLSRFVARRNR